MVNTDTLAVHVAHPAGAPGVVLLLWRPDSSGRVAFREWGSDAWLAPGRDGEATVGEVWARIAGWRREGWRFSEPPQRLAAWLGQQV